MSDLDLDDLRSELDEFAKPQKQASRTPREERIIAGFEDIQRFVEEHGRIPRHGRDHDIFERLYAVRLDRLRALEECRVLLEPFDHQGLLDEGADLPDEGELDDDALVSELGGLSSGSEDITQLKHVRSSAEKRAAEDIANRTPCKDFKSFEPLFEDVQADLDLGVRVTRPFELKSEIEQGRFFILGGQKAYVAEVGEVFTQEYGDRDARLRVIFDNGTESNLLMRSLQRALHKDEAGRRITDPVAGPLFASSAEDGDQESGTIYVLRSLSDHPYVAEHRDVIHKIGVTGGDVKTRIADAANQATYLLADVDVVATFKLYNINRSKLENLLHRFFSAARLDLEIEDRFGKSVQPREWFLVPLDVIRETVDQLKLGKISDYRYEPSKARLVKRARTGKRTRTR